MPFCGDIKGSERARCTLLKRRRICKTVFLLKRLQRKEQIWGGGKKFKGDFLIQFKLNYERMLSTVTHGLQFAHFLDATI